jgi:hypothetical protein
MKRRDFLCASIGLTLAGCLAPGIAFAAKGQITQAIAQIRKAIPYGEEPHRSSSFVQHIDNAVDHAVMTQKEHPSSALKRAISYLRRARRTAYGTHLLKNSRRAASLAQKALLHLQAAL